jgi:hypothetical protein
MQQNHQSSVRCAEQCVAYVVMCMASVLVTVAKTGGLKHVMPRGFIPLFRRNLRRECRYALLFCSIEWVLGSSMLTLLSVTL